MTLRELITVFVWDWTELLQQMQIYCDEIMIFPKVNQLCKIIKSVAVYYDIRCNF